MKMKKVISACLCCVLAFSFLASCTNPSSNAPATSAPATTAPTASQTTAAPVKANFNLEGFPIVDDKITLNVMQQMNDAHSIDFDNLWFYQQQEEKTNIHINFDVVKSADWTSKLNLMFASNEYADILLSGMNGKIAHEDLGVKQGLLVELDSYIETYMPNYFALTQLDGVDKYLKSSNGKNYYIGAIRADGKDNNAVALINEKWLEAVGAEVPTTIEELTEVLRLFKTGDPNGNGLPDEIPLQATYNALLSSLAIWGIPEMGDYFMLNGDKLELTVDKQGFREWAEWHNMMYKEQILDPEFLSQTVSVYNAKVDSNTAGYLWAARTMGLSGLGEWYAEAFNVMLPPTAEGYTPLAPRTVSLPTQGAALTIQNKHIEESLRWIDSMMEIETMMVAYHGRLGQCIELNADGLYTEITPMKEAVNDFVPAYNSMMFLPSSAYISNRTIPPYNAQRNAFAAYYKENNILEPVSSSAVGNLAIYDTDVKTKVDMLKNELKKMVEENVADFIINGVTDAKWEKFLSDLNSVGAYEYVDLVYSGYQKFLALQ